MSDSLQLLGGLTVEQFLNEYWQNKPLLIRNAFPGFQSPLSPDELAGLACEEEIESRLILEKDGPQPWTVEHGPFAESRFSSLPETHWTLLVQGVDSWHPEVAQLLEHFRFIPDWRIDDIMVSFAPEHGSVGPHLDQYDVFLLQAEGHRHWQINTRDYDQDDCIPGISLSILKAFEAEQEWTLAPGDMLYLPPGVAHYGVAQDDCLTFSVGFRAPSHSELISSFIDDLLAGLPAEQRLQDVDLQRQDNPGEIRPQALAKVRQLIRASVQDELAIDRWFGCFVTEPKNNIDIIASDLSTTEVAHFIQSHEMFEREQHSRFAFIENGTNSYLFINGDEFITSHAFADYLCKYKHYDSAELKQYFDNQHADLITTLVNNQLLVPVDE